MPSTVKGVIVRTKGAPVEVVDIVVPDPGPGEAVVKIAACGVCHTDLHYREGEVNDEFPFLLGHEAAGTVEAVGAGVTEVAPGDFVILNWRAVCGQCRACARGKPQQGYSSDRTTLRVHECATAPGRCALSEVGWRVPVVVRFRCGLPGLPGLVALAGWLRLSSVCSSWRLESRRRPPR